MSAVEGRTPLDTRRTCQKQMERQSIGTVPIRHICLMHTKKAIHKIVGTHEHVHKWSVTCTLKAKKLYVEKIHRPV